MEAARPGLCSTNNVVGQRGYENVTPPPYHVAMTRSSSRLTLPRSPSSTSTMYQGDVRGGLIENHFDVSDNSTMANYAMKLRTAKVYNVTDMVDGYIPNPFRSHGVFQLRRLWSDYNERRVGDNRFIQTLRAPYLVSHTRTASKMCLA
jgi:hypothetical protein